MSYTPPPPPPPPPGYGGGFPQPSSAANAKTNTLAIVSLITGILGCCGILAIVGIVTGIIARKQIRERGEKGDGMALAGIIIGALWIVINIGFTLLSLASGDTSSTLGALGAF